MLLRAELQTDAINSNFDNFESTISLYYTKSLSNVERQHFILPGLLDPSCKPSSMAEVVIT